MSERLLWLLACFTCLFCGTWYGVDLGEDKEYAKRAREDSLIASVQEKAQAGAAAEIAKMKPRNVTIRQEAQREIQTRVEYRDCRNSPDGLRLINEALAGKPQSVGGGELSGANPAGGQ